MDEVLNLEDLLGPAAKEDLIKHRDVYTLDVTNPMHKPGCGAKNMRFWVMTRNKQIFLTLGSLRPCYLFDLVFKIWLRLDDQYEREGAGLLYILHKNKTVMATLVKVRPLDAIDEQTVIHLS